jgi:hypothetical protein
MSVQVRREDTVTLSVGFTAGPEETIEFGRLIKEAGEQGYKINSIGPVTGGRTSFDTHTVGMRVVLSR